MSKKDHTKWWNKKAEELLLNKKIVKVEYMHSEEAKDSMWDSRCVRIILDNGTNILPMRDDEGNDAGSLWLGDGRMEEVLPVLGLED
jgi:hypothetical protein